MLSGNRMVTHIVSISCTLEQIAHAHRHPAAIAVSQEEGLLQINVQLIFMGLQIREIALHTVNSKQAMPCLFFLVISVFIWLPPVKAK